MTESREVFVDTGAWIALALRRDPYHEQAAATWLVLQDSRTQLHTSVPVVLETFTFLDRNTLRQVAVAWKNSLEAVDRLVIHPCDLEDLDRSWSWFDRQDLHKLSAVDATSFEIMRRAEVDTVFAFDHHFAMAGFRMLG